MKKEKKIETPTLLIKGNIICWEGTTVQISNISCISITSLDLPPLPIGRLIFILVGVFLILFKVIIGLIIVGIGLMFLYSWVSECDEREAIKNLNLDLNSGHVLVISIKDQNFLNDVISVLQDILYMGTIGDKEIVINIENSNITGNTSILNDANI